LIEYDNFASASIFIPTFAIILYLFRKISDRSHRLTLLTFIVGFYLYSGIGGAEQRVGKIYILFYLSFLTLFVIAYLIGIRDTKISNQNISILSARGESGRRHWGGVIVLYYTINLFPFFYPELQLEKLLSLTGPNLTNIFRDRFLIKPTDAISKLVDYLDILLMPFFYIAIFKYRKKMFKLTFAIFGLLYLQYSLNGYIGRGQLMMALTTIYLAIFIHYRGYSLIKVLAPIILMPVMFQGMYWYSLSRIGSDIQSGGFSDSIYAIFHQETNFPYTVVQKILDYNYRVEFSSYIKWIVTLPIPKILTGDIDGARINYEISEDILNVKRNSLGFYVMLPGLLGESIYIYGRHLFLVQAVIIGLLLSKIINMLKRYEEMNILLLYTIVTFAFVLNRGGFSSTLPIVVNQYMLLYVYIYWNNRRSRENTI